MYQLDSRNLGPQNCYFQKVISKDDVTLEVRKSSAAFLPMDKEKSKNLKVKALTASQRSTRDAGKQHVIPLDFKDNDFQIDLSKIDIREGDTLVFHQAQRKQPSFAVRGKIGKINFDSSSLTDQAVYTHAFGLPGRYEWADANGSGIGGVVNVVNETADGRKGAERIMKSLENGVLVHIVGKKVSPAEVTISTGQTVFFAVEETAGITITDVNLLPKKAKAK